MAVKSSKINSRGAPCGFHYIFSPAFDILVRTLVPLVIEYFDTGQTMKDKFEPKKFAVDEEMMYELILYITQSGMGDANLAATKLNKLLFYADFSAYLNFGKPITGCQYQALERGPAPRRLIPIREAMEARGDIYIYQHRYHEYVQDKILPLREPDLSKFTAEEIALVDKLIQMNWHKTGKEVSDESHQFVGWKFADVGETIPYEVALVGFREPTPDEVKYGLSLSEMARQEMVA